MPAIQISLPFKADIIVRADDPHILQLLQLKYGDYAVACTVENDTWDIDITTCGQYYTVRNRRTTQHTTRPFRVLNDMLYAEPFDPSVLTFHGGAVAYRGGAYLFLAPTTSGKTTLTGFLTAQGTTYLTDDCIIIDKQHRVHPFTTPIHLREGGFAILQQQGCLPDNVAFMDDPSMMRHVFTPHNRATHPVPLKRIFFISRTNTENAVRGMTTTEKMTALMRSPIKEQPLNAAYLSRLAALTQYPCDTLYYHDMAYVREVMEHE